MNRPTRHRTALSIVVVAVAACGTKTPSQDPSGFDVKRWLVERETGPLVRHVLDRKVYYFARGTAYDGPNYLYDENGNYVCDPGGGFVGQGDGKCPPRLRELFRRSDGVMVPNPFYKP